MKLELVDGAAVSLQDGSVLEFCNPGKEAMLSWGVVLRPGPARSEGSSQLHGRHSAHRIKWIMPRLPATARMCSPVRSSMVQSHV